MRTITLPQATKTMTDATVVRWLKAVSESVAAGDVLVEVQTSRDVIQISADGDGVLAEILVAEGQTAAVGAPIAKLDSAGAQVAPPAPAEVAPAPAPGGNVTPIIMPKAGNTMEEGTIIAWRVKEGDAIAVGDVIYEVETDKAAVEVEATDAGRLAKIVAGEGDIVEVFAPVAYMADNDADVAGIIAAAPAPAEAAPAPAAVEGPVGDVTPIIMPKAGNTMEEGTIITWRIAEGDTIAVGDVIFEVETDKAAVEVEATDAGRVAKIVAGEGDIVEVFGLLAVLADSDADADAYIAQQGATAAPKAAPAAPAPTPAAPASAPAAPAAPATPAATTAAGRVKASPAARKLAAQRNIDLAAVGAGSGPGGRILTTDVPAAAPAAAAAVAVTVTPGVAGRTAMSSMRKAIATNLQVSKQTIPHFYIETTVAADAMMTFYRAQKAQYPCTVNDLVVRAAAIAINEFAPFRSRIEGADIVTEADANIGIAVGMDDGLVVPVVLAADQLNLQQTGVETRKVVDAARAGKIPNMGKGVFTISNMGMFGIHRFAAIINPPESGILAVGAVREDTIVADGAIKAARVMTATLSCDHRVVDGMVAAQFLNRVKELLEAPESLL